jgi:hypothetical protein
MSIRLLAKELYGIMREVRELEKALAGLSPGAERTALEQRLRKARAEEARIKAFLEGAKES